MLIECPSCHARAKLPDTKEGAKVRCGECSRVYVALPAGAKAHARTGTNTGLVIGIAVAVVALLVLVFLTRSGDQATKPVVAAGPAATGPALQPEELGWDGRVVQAAVKVHEAAHLPDVNRLHALIDAAGTYAWHRSLEEAAGTDQGDEDDAAEGAAPAAPVASPPDAALVKEYEALPGDRRELLLAGWMDELTQGTGKELVADWRPYDGRVIALGDRDAIVHVDTTRREPEDGTKRTIEWHLRKVGDDWKVWSWERWISPEERLAAQRAKKRIKGYQKVTLSDGSIVLERNPEPLPYLDDTPAELREKIDALYAKMTDLNLTKEASEAEREIEAIGKPAIPKLLTGLYEIPLDTQENAIRCNVVVQALRGITGQYFGYQPQLLVGSATGTTDERRQSAIKQWFAWWYREGDTFVAKEVTDGLEGKIRLSEKEEKWLERNKDE